MPDIDLLNVQLGSVSAPAGCGKTHLIATSLLRHDGVKPVLILTHTNAGVAALRARLQNMGVPRKAYRITTIDGWAMRLIGTFPQRSGHPPNTLALKNPRKDYPAIRAGVQNIFRGNHIRDVLQATYARLIVDEYQDCVLEQHAMVSKIAEVLPTCVLGDEMQAIFGWGNNVLVNWQTDVQARFPAVGQLETPWRWRNVGTEGFGQWLLWAREALRAGNPIDVRTTPPEVHWMQITGKADIANLTRASNVRPPNDNGSVLIVCDSTRPQRHRQIASRAFGAVVVENADLTDFIRFSENFDFRAADAVDKIVDFAGDTLTGVATAHFKKRVKSIHAATARTPPTDAEIAAVNFINVPSPSNAVGLLVEINKQQGVTSLRPALLRTCIQALNACSNVDDFYEMAVKAREQSRVLGRSLPRKAVGSTLLLKGLEADVAVIIDTEQLSARDLYVAMTRGSRQLIICSTNPILNPAPA
ncbi:UvrD-helicase domain-containing protein [Pseudovibrio sp. POLY-S9]|uniref:UvrD-helicase domain-containing protein n=1 Tax=Pseudovibrio sp. POLY-S9 TaxID=1576596 RepID=UPI000B0872E9|nr:UvrD-helicase domain-containing protein [Pseudovibrio sp. POLY-S9]